MAWRLCQQLAHLHRHFAHFDRQLFLEDRPARPSAPPRGVTEEELSAWRDRSVAGLLAWRTTLCSS
eukprot:4566714-Pyramimonas_sp.AAC.1